MIWRTTGRKPWIDISGFIKIAFASHQEIEEQYGLRKQFISDTKQWKRVWINSNDFDKLGLYVDDVQAEFSNLIKQKNDYQKT